MKPLFIVILSSLIREHIVSNAMLFYSFDEALAYARKQAEHRMFLASTYVEKIGDNKRHVTIEVHGKNLNVNIRVSDICCFSTRENSILRKHPNTYCTWDCIGDQGI